MQGEIEELEFDIADLETRLAIATSAAEMYQRALDLGFVPVDRDQLTYLVVPGYVANQRLILAPPPEPVRLYPAAPPPDYTESLVDWLQARALPYIERQLGVRP